MLKGLPAMNRQMTSFTDDGMIYQEYPLKKKQIWNLLEALVREE